MISVSQFPALLLEDLGARLDSFDQAVAAASVRIPDNAQFREELEHIFVFSRFASRICTRYPHFIADLIASGDLFNPYPSETYRHKLQAITLAEDGEAGFSRELRRFRNQEMVRIAWRDLSSRADLDETMADLTALAEACIDRVVSQLYRHQCGQYGTPENAAGQAQQLVVIGMGKLGGKELNFSSDVDLVFAYEDPGRTRGQSRAVENEEFFVRLGRKVVGTLQSNTPDGFVYRVDLGLRPHGDNGPLVMHFDAMEEYYLHQGREWERYAWIKAREVAGDLAAGKRLLKRLNPFIFRRYLDFGAFESLRHMKQMIASDVRRKGMRQNIKLGAGGIRQIEFFGQIFQLIRGGVAPQMQVRSIRKIISLLVDEGLIPPGVGQELGQAYGFLRRTEHRLQEFADAQTHDLPADDTGRMRLALSMGFESWAAFKTDLDRHLGHVSNHFERLLEDKSDAPEDQPQIQARHQRAELGTVWLKQGDPERWHSVLQNAGFEDSRRALTLLDSLIENPETRALTREGRERLDRLIPMVLQQAGDQPEPNLALGRLVDLLRVIERRSCYLSLLLENPTALVHMVSLCAASPWITAFLSHHPLLLDELIDRRTLFKPPEKNEMQKELRHRLAQLPADDLERHMDEMRVFRLVKTLRVVSADLTGSLPLMKVSDHLSDIAEVLLDEALKLAWQYMTAKHGTPVCHLEDASPGNGFAVFAYGKLGGFELGYGSDLDLVFLHAGTREYTCGSKRPLDSPQFFARLGQRMIHLLTSRTTTGTLYEIDMRLRPSGNSGPLVFHVDAFAEYQLARAWTWEHQALLRARPICGDALIAKRFDAIRREALSRPRLPAALREEVLDMRIRLRKSQLKAEPGQFDLKQGTGGIVDIEFLVQYLVLTHAHKHPQILRWTDNVRLIGALLDAGIIDDQSAHILRTAYLVYRTYAHRLGLDEKPGQVPADKFLELRNLIKEIWKQQMMD